VVVAIFVFSRGAECRRGGHGFNEYLASCGRGRFERRAAKVSRHFLALFGSISGFCFKPMFASTGANQRLPAMTRLGLSQTVCGGSERLRLGGRSCAFDGQVPLSWWNLLRRSYTQSWRLAVLLTIPVIFSLFWVGIQCLAVAL